MEHILGEYYEVTLLDGRKIVYKVIGGSPEKVIVNGKEMLATDLYNSYKSVRGPLDKSEI